MGGFHRKIGLQEVYFVTSTSILNSITLYCIMNAIQLTNDHRNTPTGSFQNNLNSNLKDQQEGF